MQKKLLAIAVAGALGAPALAQAQTSSVQVFGKIYYEYGVHVSQGASSTAPGDRQNVDMMQTPGSEIGFKGEEKLGNGLSAWFQCASTADYRGQSPEGFCSRNSGVGLKGAFGNFWMGNWDTPFKRALGRNLITNQTGLYGASFLLAGGATTVQGRGNPAQFMRRQRDSINYDSPRFGGFQLSASTNSTNQSTGATSAQTAAKARLWSFAGTYDNGPLNITGGYEIHKDFNSATGGSGAQATGFSGTDKAWELSAGYTYGPVKLGAIYTRQKFEPAAGQELKVNAWHLAALWHIAGPSSLRATYTKAGDTTGTYTAAGGITGSSSTRVANGGAGGTGAHLWQVTYVHTLSKRTAIDAGYVRLDNNTNAIYGLGGLSAPRAGADQDAWVVSMTHRF
jgi:predicted porin